MYSIVLATMLTTGSATPAHFFHGGCWGCGGCYGCSGCYGCGGCWGGCWGCGGCWGGCYGCGGCWGGGYYYGGGGYYVPQISYYGCCGGVVVDPANGGKKKTMEKLPDPNATEEDGEEAQSKVTVVIKAPLDVKIRFNGQLARRSAAQQRFVTPVLEQGRTYSYEIEAEAIHGGKKVIKTEKIQVKAGKVARLDFAKMATANAEDNKARVTVLLPADAKLYVDGVICPLTSAKRTFDTPRLKPGRDYFYNLKVEVVRDGETLTDSRRVTMQAGADVQVEFKNIPATEQAARR